MSQSAFSHGEGLAARYERDGFVIFDRFVAADTIDELRAECADAIADRDAEMTRLGVDRLDLCHRGRRYFLHSHHRSEPVRRFVASAAMVGLARGLLGDRVYLFNEQFVYKAAEQGLGFGWHQDSGYIPYSHRPYLTCWIPLDDVNQTNGTVSLLPYSVLGGSGVAEHRRDAATGDLVGYDGDEAGVVVEVAAGSVVAFSSTVMHRTLPNTTERPRRVLVVQYSAEPILDEAGLAPRHLADLLTSAGKP